MPNDTSARSTVTSEAEGRLTSSLLKRKNKNSFVKKIVAAAKCPKCGMKMSMHDGQGGCGKI